ncbi:MAG: hypothetical protein NC092_05780 [Butyrivibrio sp.]|nr:hypothetical protein [Muribaculum sp.]MCM1552186.1 hypothetical protein [Butyrivibrio sp.]
MSDISVTKKLELIKQIRSRYQQDRYDMFHRERLLYGRTTPIPVENDELAKEAVSEEESFSTFPLRVLVAAVLFVMIILCDISGKSFLGIPSSRCFSAISADYESDITKWAEAASNAASQSPPAGARP